MLRAQIDELCEGAWSLRNDRDKLLESIDGLSMLDVSGDDREVFEARIDVLRGTICLRERLGVEALTLGTRALLVLASNDIWRARATMLTGHARNVCGEVDEAEAHLVDAAEQFEALGVVDVPGILFNVVAKHRLQKGDIPGSYAAYE